MYAAPDGALFGTYAQQQQQFAPTAIAPTAVAAAPVGTYVAGQRPVERRVVMHRSLIPEARTVAVPRVIPTQHTVIENVPVTIQTPATVQEQITHTVVENHTVMEPHTITVPKTILENHTVTEQVPRTVMEPHTVMVPRQVFESVTVKEPHTVMEPVQRVIQVPKVVPEAREIQVPRIELVPRVVTQQVAKTIIEPRQVVQQVPRTVVGQRTIIHQQAVHSARVVEVPRYTEIERPQVIQQVIPGRARQYMGPPRVVGQVQGGLQHVGTVEAGPVATAIAPQPFFSQGAPAAAYPSYGSFGVPSFGPTQFQSVNHAGFPQFVSQQAPVAAGAEDDGFRA